MPILMEFMKEFMKVLSIPIIRQLDMELVGLSFLQEDHIREGLFGIKWRDGENYSILLVAWRMRGTGNKVNFKVMESYSIKNHCTLTLLTAQTLSKFNRTTMKVIGNIMKEI